MKDGRVWAASYGSMLQPGPQQCCLMDLSPWGLYPLFSISPSSPCPPPKWFIPLLPRIHHDSHPLSELNYRCGPSESSITLPPSPSIFGYHQTSIWAETGAWLHWRAQLSSFYETMRVWSHTRTHTPLALMALFAGRVFHFKMLECLQVMTQNRFSGGQCNSTGRTL